MRVDYDEDDILTEDHYDSVRLRLALIHKPIEVSTVAITGVMDRQTAKIPYYRGVLELDRLVRRVMKDCTAHGRDPVICYQGSAYPNALYPRAMAQLSHAAEALDALELVEESLPFSRPSQPASFRDPMRYSSLCDWGFVAPPPDSLETEKCDAYGFHNVDCPRYSQVYYIKESLDPDELGPWLWRISAAERHASDELMQAATLIDDLFGDGQ